MEPKTNGIQERGRGEFLFKMFVYVDSFREDWFSSKWNQNLLQFFANFQAFLISFACAHLQIEPIREKSLNRRDEIRKQSSFSFFRRDFYSAAKKDPIQWIANDWLLPNLPSFLQGSFFSFLKFLFFARERNDSADILQVRQPFIWRFLSKWLWVAEGEIVNIFLRLLYP